MYCNVLPVDASDFAFFKSIKKRFPDVHNHFRQEFLQKRAALLSTLRAKLARNHKSNKNRSRLALIARIRDVELNYRG
jgi:hypothetical protein